MENKNLFTFIEQLPLYAQIILFIFFGGILGGIIRLQTYVVSKNTATLIGGLVWACLGEVTLVPKILDLFTLIGDKKISILND